MLKVLGTYCRKNEVFIYYSYLDETTNIASFQVASSTNGFKFSNIKTFSILDNEGHTEDLSRCTDFKISLLDDSYFLTYKFQEANTTSLRGATSSDLQTWEKIGTYSDIHEAGMVVPFFRYEKKYVMYFGEKDIHVAYSSDLKIWEIQPERLLEGRPGLFDEVGLKLASVFQTSHYLFVVYYVKNSGGYSAGLAVFDKRNPKKFLWRTNSPIWKQPESLKNQQFTPIGAVHAKENILLYWQIDDKDIFAVSCHIPQLPIDTQKHFSISLHRHPHNPILKPNPKNPWESRAAFNTAAVYDDGKVHFVYRALGDTDLSVLGYATSKDGVHIDERFKDPIYVPTEPFESPGQKVYKTFPDHFMSGGGYGGCEDPRITKVDDTYYMTYVAFDGCTPPRVALTSIKRDNFLKRTWKWAKPKLISAPGMVNKNAVIFPEKVNGKYVVFHRVFPNILVDLVDDLEFNEYLRGDYLITPSIDGWDTHKIGAGAPPIKTKDGWLFIYQGVGKKDRGRYKIGAMLLDLNNPTKVLFRSQHPLLAPDENYENEGHKAGVVYPCGSVVIGDRLYVYYGGADTVVCGASQDLNTFLEQLKTSHIPTFEPVESPRMGIQ